MDISGRLTDTGHELTQRVYYEDTDFSGRVYHARYLHFMERGRSDFLRLLGIGHRELAAESLAFAVRRMEVDFLRPAQIDDVLTIITRAAGTTGARIALDQEVLCASSRLIQAKVSIVLIGPQGRPARLPAAIRHAFQVS